MTDTNPENQDQPLIDGKYKSADEVLAALKEQQRVNSSLNESLAREQRLNALLDDVQKPEPVVNQPVDDLGIAFASDEDKKKFQSFLANQQQAIYQTVGQIVDSRITNVDKKKDAENRFYTTNKDLVDFKIEVEHFAKEVANEYGPRVKTVDQDTLFKEVAERARKYLSGTKSKLAKTPLHLEGGNMSEPDTQVQERTSKESSEEERMADFVKNELPAHNKKKNTPLSGVA